MGRGLWRRGAAGAVAVCVVVAAAAAAQSGSRRGDEDALRAVVARYVAAREQRDPAGLAALFVEDSDQLVSSGEWRRGRDAVVKGGLASSARSSGTRTIEVEHVRLVGADVAIVDGRYEVGASGAAAARRMWTTFVMVRTADGWRISAIRNMLPAAP